MKFKQGDRVRFNYADTTGSAYETLYGIVGKHYDEGYVIKWFELDDNSFISDGHYLEVELTKDTKYMRDITLKQILK